MSCDIGEATKGLKKELWRRKSDGSVGECSFSILSVTSSTSQLILQPFRRFSYVTAHSLTLPMLHLRHSSFSNTSFASPTSQALHLRQQSSFSNLSVTSPTSQLILQPFRRFIYVTAHSASLPMLHLRHISFSNTSFAYPTSQALHLRQKSSFSNLSVTSPTSQLILQPYRRFTYVAAHSPTLLSLYLRHNSFSNPPAASLMSHFILQHFFRFSYVTSSSLNSPGEPPMELRNDVMLGTCHA